MSSRPLGVISGICWFVGLTFGWSTANAQVGALIDLGPVTDGFGEAAGINNSGQVLLSSGIYSNGVITPLPSNMLGIAIDANGDVAGTVGQHAALYRNGTVTDLGVLPGADPLTDRTQATAINASGQVVGYGSTPSATRIGFLYDGSMTAIGALPGTQPAAYVSEANGIDDAGQVAGTAWNGTNPTHAFVYDHGVWTDLGPGSGNAINNSGMVTGGLANGDAFIYSGGKINDIGALVPSIGTGAAGAAGTAINSTGQVVGYSSEWNGDATTFRYFFFNGVMNDLKALVNPSDPLISQVRFDGVVGINDSRLIAVRGLTSDAVEHRYLLQAPWIDIAPGPLSFPSQPSGTTSSTQSVTVTNAGPAAVAMGTISTFGDFTQTNSCGTGLAPGAHCDVMVAFSPTFPGSQTGGVSIISDGVPVVVPLSGIAPFDVSISASATAVVTGEPVTLTWAAPLGAICSATGGSSADGWIGSVAVSGTQSVIETSGGGSYLYGIQCRNPNNTAASQAQVAVMVSWPALSVSLTASPTTINSENSTMLKWSSANAKTCVASGGGANDSWAGTTRPTTGSASISEPVVVASPLTLTYTLTCSNSTTGQSTPASVKVVLNPPANSSGGGGGALSPLFLLLMTGVAARRLIRQGNLH